MLLEYDFFSNDVFLLILWMLKLIHRSIPKHLIFLLLAIKVWHTFLERHVEGYGALEVSRKVVTNACGVFKIVFWLASL